MLLITEPESGRLATQTDINFHEYAENEIPSFLENWMMDNLTTFLR